MRRTAVSQQNEIIVEQGPAGYISIIEINDTEKATAILIPSSRINALVRCLKAAKRENDRDF